MSTHPSSVCHVLSVPNTQWSFCPSLGAACTLAVLFGLVMCAHLFQAVLYRKAYCWVITMGALWQVIAYVLRITSIRNPALLGPYVGWFVLILVAPLWTNAFVYMVVGRMVWNYTPTAKVRGVTAWRFGLYFVVLDLIAFIIQVYGASSAAASNTDSDIELGIHVYMGGVGIQQLIILLFVFFAVQFHRVLRQQPCTDETRQAKILLYTLYLVLLLIMVRIIFRLVEYSSGLTSRLPKHEVYQYCLDSLPMLLAFVCLNVIHPGRIMRGRERDMPSRKERKKHHILTRSDHLTTLPKTETIPLQ